MMCNCIDEINAEIETKNTRLSMAFSFGGGSSLIIATESITKKRGSRPVLAIPTYCPFCGTKYLADDRAKPLLTGVAA